MASKARREVLPREGAGYTSVCQSRVNKRKTAETNEDEENIVRSTGTKTNTTRKIKECTARERKEESIAEEPDELKVRGIMVHKA